MYMPLRVRETRCTSLDGFGREKLRQNKYRLLYGLTARPAAICVMNKIYYKIFVIGLDIFAKIGYNIYDDSCHHGLSLPCKTGNYSRWEPYHIK